MSTHTTRPKRVDVVELSELFAHVMANLFTNYFNHYAETELDILMAPGLSTASG